MTACNDIASELAALRADIAALDNRYVLKSEKRGIALESANIAEASIMPKIPGIAQGIIMAALVPISAKVATVIATITGLTASIATLMILESKVNELQGKIQAIEAWSQEIFSRVFQAIFLARKAQDTADKAFKQANEAYREGIQARTEAYKAKGTADYAVNVSNNAQDAANQAKSLADYAVKQLPPIEAKLNQAEKIAREILVKLPPIENKASEANNKAIRAEKIANEVASKLQPIENKANQAIDKSTKAERVADDAIGKVNKVEEKVNKNEKLIINLGNWVVRIDKTAYEAWAKAQQANALSEQAMAIIGTIIQALANFDKMIANIYAELRKVNLRRIPMPISNAPQEIAKLGNQLEQQRLELEKLKLTTPEIQKEVDKLKQEINKPKSVDQQTKTKIDQILTTLPLIPARTAQQIRPSIPTQEQITTATQTGMCRSTQPGGCMKKALDDQTNQLNNQANQNKNDLLNKIGAGLDAAIMALLQKMNALLLLMDKKLGAQLPKGISGKLLDGFKWLQIDRALNVLTLAATVHNAVMLSKDIGETLVQTLSNVLQAIGLKDDKGQPFNVGEAIGNSITGFIQSAIGTENYNELVKTWKKANRIYQASANLLDSFQNLTNTILNALEITAGRVGKIGNALRKAGEVLENAYGWMNPQPKFNRIQARLEDLGEAADFVLQVSQIPIETTEAITELTEAQTELVKALKEDTEENKGTKDEEPTALKTKEVTSKSNSAGKDITETDLEQEEE